jgi:hypothetical protein
MLDKGTSFVAPWFFPGTLDDERFNLSPSVERLL